MGETTASPFAPAQLEAAVREVLRRKRKRGAMVAVVNHDGSVDFRIAHRIKDGRVSRWDVGAVIAHEPGLGLREGWKAGVHITGAW